MRSDKRDVSLSDVALCIHASNRAILPLCQETQGRRA